jgi:hypothetical protein
MVGMGLHAPKVGVEGHGSRAPTEQRPSPPQRAISHGPATRSVQSSTEAQPACSAATTQMAELAAAW